MSHSSRPGQPAGPRQMYVTQRAGRRAQEPGLGVAGGARAVVVATAPAPAVVEEDQVQETAPTDLPWCVIVWDDPVTLMSYVAFVLQKVFGYDKSRARDLMLKVHNDGKAAVSSGSRDQCEKYVQRLHEHGLWASMERSSS